MLILHTLCFCYIKIGTLGVYISNSECNWNSEKKLPLKLHQNSQVKMALKKIPNKLSRKQPCGPLPVYVLSQLCSKVIFFTDIKKCSQGLLS